MLFEPCLLFLSSYSSLIPNVSKKWCYFTVSVMFIAWKILLHYNLFIYLFIELVLLLFFTLVLLPGFSNVPRIVDTISSKASLLPLYRKMISFSPLFSWFSLCFFLFIHISFWLMYYFSIIFAFQHQSLTVSSGLSFSYLFSILPSPIWPVLSVLVFIFMLFYDFLFVCCISESFLFSTPARSYSNLYVTVT